MPDFDSAAVGREIAGPCSYTYTDCFCYPNRTRCDNCERTRNFTVAINKIESERNRLRKALELVLPFARGYVALNNVGSNASYIREAENALANKENT